MKKLLFFILATTLQAQEKVGMRSQDTFLLASPPTVVAGTVLIFSDSATLGSCTAGGSALATCRWSGSAWQPTGGGGGAGIAPYLSSLITGPDSTKTITGATHGFATTALLVAVYDNATPRKPVAVDWSVNSSTYDVVITFSSAQSNYYVVINGGVGPVGPQGSPGIGTIGSGSNPQIAQYDGPNSVKAVTVSGNIAIADGGAATIQPNAVITSMINANAVTSAKQSAEITRRTVCIPFGAKNALMALADTDLADADLYFVPAAYTLVEITVRADAGTPNVILGRDRAGTVVNLTSAALATAASGALACSNAGGTTGINGTTTCGATLQNTSLNVGDWIKPVSGTAGGAAKQMSACLTFVTVN